MKFVVCLFSPLSAKEYSFGLNATSVIAIVVRPFSQRIDGDTSRGYMLPSAGPPTHFVGNTLFRRNPELGVWISRKSVGEPLSPESSRIGKKRRYSRMSTVPSNDSRGFP